MVKKNYLKNGKTCRVTFKYPNEEISGFNRNILPHGCIGKVLTLGSKDWSLLRGAERALLGEVAPAEQQGTAFVLYYLLSGIMILAGCSGLFGAVGNGWV